MNLQELTCRQVREALVRGDLEAFDAMSVVYQWDPELVSESSLGMWKKFQAIGEELWTVPQANSSQEAQDLFCNGRCEAHGGVRSLLRLRGVTAMRAFSVEEEIYLAVSQSICDRFQPAQDCLLEGPQPRSGIFQFNKQTGRFEEISSSPTSGFLQSDYGSVGTRTSREQAEGKSINRNATEQALRMNLGRARKIEYEVIGGRGYLVTCSASNGVELYEWRFSSHRIANANSVLLSESSAASALVFVSSLYEAAVKTYELVSNYQDDVGLVPSAFGSRRLVELASSSFMANDVVRNLLTDLPS